MAGAAPRPTTPRGALTAEEQQNIDIFEKWKASVVYIATTEQVVDFWTRNVTACPAARARDSSGMRRDTS
jgi:hypothetical protein